MITLAAIFLLPNIALASNPELEAAMARLRACAEAQDPACFEAELPANYMHPDVKGVVASRWGERGETEAARQLLRQAVEEMINWGVGSYTGNPENYARHLFLLSERQRRLGFEVDAMRARTAVALASIPADGEQILHSGNVFDCDYSRPDPDVPTRVLGPEFRIGSGWYTGPLYAAEMARVELQLGYPNRAEAALNTMLAAMKHLSPHERIERAPYFIEAVTEIGSEALVNELGQALFDSILKAFDGCDRAGAFARYYAGSYSFLSETGRSNLVDEILASFVEYGDGGEYWGSFAEAGAPLMSRHDLVEYLEYEIQREPNGFEYWSWETDPWSWYQPIDPPPRNDAVHTEAVGEDYPGEVYAAFREMPAPQLVEHIRTQQHVSHIASRILRERSDELLCFSLDEDAFEVLRQTNIYQWDFGEHLTSANVFIVYGQSDDAYDQIIEEIDFLPEHREHHRDIHSRHVRWHERDPDRHRAPAPFDDEVLPSMPYHRANIAAVGMSVEAANRTPLEDQLFGGSPCPQERLSIPDF